MKSKVHFAYEFEGAAARLLCNNRWTLLATPQAAPITGGWTIVKDKVTCEDCIKKLKFFINKV